MPMTTGHMGFYKHKIFIPTYLIHKLIFLVGNFLTFVALASGHIPLHHKSCYVGNKIKYISILHRARFVVSEKRLFEA